MKANEIVMAVMKDTVTLDGKKYTQTRIAEELTERSDKKVTLAAVNDRLKTENMRINTLIEMLDLMGYEVVARPKNDKRDSYVVEPGSDRKRVK